MITSNPIVHWLITAFEQPIGFITENFYYDKRNKEFFSVMIFDYFMLDENMEMAGNVTSNYSQKEEISLADRMKRIENKDPVILSIPKVELKERKEVMLQFVQSLSDPALIELLNHKIKNQDATTKFDFYFENEVNEVVIQKWKDVKTRFLHQQVDRFLNLYDINIDNTTLWMPDSESFVNINLAKSDNAEISLIESETQNKRRWWRFW